MTGKLIDRFDARKVILPSIILVGLLPMSLYFPAAKLWHFYLLCGATGGLGAWTGMAAAVAALAVEISLKPVSKIWSPLLTVLMPTSTGVLVRFGFLRR